MIVTITLLSESLLVATKTNYFREFFSDVKENVKELNSNATRVWQTASTAREHSFRVPINFLG